MARKKAELSDEYLDQYYEYVEAHWHDEIDDMEEDPDWMDDYHVNDPFDEALTYLPQPGDVTWFEGEPWLVSEWDEKTWLYKLESLGTPHRRKINILYNLLGEPDPTNLVKWRLAKT